MRRPMVAGNWKMHGDRPLARELAAAARDAAGRCMDVDVVVVPPYPLIDTVVNALDASKVQVAAQDVSEHAKGAYTGDVAGGMLVESGCRLTLVGHSERRQFHGESNDTVARKFAAAQAAGLVPILCIGETLQEREEGRTEAVVGAQLGAVIAHVGVNALAAAVLAYEPVWAIGTGLTASPAQAQAVHGFLRSEVERHDVRIAASLRILYGGSVKSDNAGGLFGQADIDGGLVGGASLVAADFAAIVHAAQAN